DLAPALTVLQLFLSSAKPALKFAAMRALSEVAAIHPGAVAKANDEMEGLVGDANRSVATLAVTTLLKTGTEAGIERLMKQISTFMADLSDEFKVVIVTAVKDLCLKFPKKHRVLAGFLASFLREEGGHDFKRAIVDSLVELMTQLPELKEASLLYLCEFIEDCEFADLIVQVLHVVGRVGPATSAPSRYIRFVFNRVILENAAVRAAAVSTLGAFACRVPELRTSLAALVRRSAGDEDDEVRDRAVSILQGLQGREESTLRFVFDEPMPLTFTALERSLRALQAQPVPLLQMPSFGSLPLVDDHVHPHPPGALSKAQGLKRTEASEAGDGGGRG
ncbi:MAG: hypothetical protein EOO70_10325, partial [Myxococcaceae bacterium]